MPAYYHGLVELRRMFPEIGISNRNDDMTYVMDEYPGNQNLYEFIVNSAHGVTNMIEVYVCKYKDKLTIQGFHKDLFGVL